MPIFISKADLKNKKRETAIIVAAIACACWICEKITSTAISSSIANKEIEKLDKEMRKVALPEGDS